MKSQSSEYALDQLDRCVRIVHFNDQFVEPLVMQVNPELRVMHVPEDLLAVLIEGSCRDDTGDIRARQPDAGYQPRAASGSARTPAI